MGFLPGPARRNVEVEFERNSCPSSCRLSELCSGVPLCGSVHTVLACGSRGGDPEKTQQSKIGNGQPSPVYEDGWFSFYPPPGQNEILRKSSTDAPTRREILQFTARSSAHLYTNLGTKTYLTCSIKTSSHPSKDPRRITLYRGFREQNATTACTK